MLVAMERGGEKDQKKAWVCGREWYQECDHKLRMCCKYIWVKV